MPFFKTTDGNNLHYRITGKGKPIIFVHGWAMNSLIWKYQSDKLAKDFQVIAVDLREHGKSECEMRNAEYGFNLFLRYKEIYAGWVVYGVLYYCKILF